MQRKNVGATLAVIGGSLGLLRSFLESGAAPLPPSLVSGVGGVIGLAGGLILLSTLGSDDSREIT